jgi:hypothetical protein
MKKGKPFYVDVQIKIINGILVINILTEYFAVLPNAHENNLEFENTMSQTTERNSENKAGDTLSSRHVSSCNVTRAVRM